MPVTISRNFLSLFLAFLATIFALALSPSASADLKPLSGELMLHDPTLIQDGNTWYAFGTGELNQGGIRRLKSDDGLFWYEMPTMLSSPLPWWSTYVPGHETNQWAPDIIHYNGRYYLLYSVSSFGQNNSLIGMVSTTDLESDNWRDDGLVIRSTNSDDYNAIDGDITFDENGQPWMSFGSFWSGIKLTRLDSDLQPTGQVYSIASRPNTPDNAIEAPRVTYHEGFYYLFVSWGHCCDGAASTYRIVVGRSQDIAGPYLDKNGVSMMNGGGFVLEDAFSNYAGPGGQDVINDNVLVRHAYDTTQNGLPQLLISDLYWDDQGWPTLDAPQAGDSSSSSSSSNASTSSSPSSSESSSSDSSVEGLVSGQTYILRNRASGLVAETEDGSTADGADVVQWEENGGTNQHWTAVDAGDGFYTLLNENGGKALEITSWSTSNGGNAVQYTDLDGNNQQWSLTDLGNGYYRIENRHSGRALDGYGTSNGSDIIQYDYHGGDNQQWELTLVGGVSSSSSSSEASSASSSSVEGSDEIVSGATYKLVNRTSGRVAEVVNAETQDGADVVQWDDNGTANQHWVITDTGEGLYALNNANSGKALEVWQWNLSNGGDVRQATDYSYAIQRWSLIDLGNGYYRIENDYSGLALDGNGTSNGADVIQYDYLDANNQQWQIIRVD